MNFWALCAISAHLNVIAKHPCMHTARVPGVSITLNAYSLSCVIKNCKRPKIYLATTLTIVTCTNNAFNSIASILLFTELHVE